MGIDTTALNTAVLNPRASMIPPHLKKGRPLKKTLAGLEIPWSRAGTFACVFKVDVGGTDKALRVFLTDVGPEMRDRYRCLAQSLKAKAAAITVSFQYHEEGLAIGNRKYPIVEMDWADGNTLLEEVETRNHKGLQDLAQRWAELVLELDRVKMAHGDLAAENVMVVGKRLVLIDYDGVFFDEPVLRNHPPNEKGNPKYQHRQSQQRCYNERMDDFSALAVYVALLAIAEDGSLFKKYADPTEGKLLFDVADFADPARSKLFADLRNLRAPTVRELVKRLEDACFRPIDQVPKFRDALARTRSVRKAVEHAHGDPLQKRVQTPPFAPTLPHKPSASIDVTRGQAQTQPQTVPAAPHGVKRVIRLAAKVSGIGAGVILLAALLFWGGVSATKRIENRAVPPAPQEITLDLGGGTSLEMALIPAGSFMMGNDQHQPVHKVHITQPFYLSKYLVTQEQWQAVMGGNPSHFKGPRQPVEEVSWQDCQEFVEKLNAKVGGGKFSLPTEAQWEYACRAGSTTQYYFGDDESKLGEYAWYNANSGHKTHPVGEKQPNAWELYDMHGNVSEWCADWYGGEYYVSSPTEDPTGPATGVARVSRGGCCGSEAQHCCSACRGDTRPENRGGQLGFRVARGSAGPVAAGASPKPAAPLERDALAQTAAPSKPPMAALPVGNAQHRKEKVQHSRAAEASPSGDRREKRLDLPSVTPARSSDGPLGRFYMCVKGEFDLYHNGQAVLFENGTAPNTHQDERSGVSSEIRLAEKDVLVVHINSHFDYRAFRLAFVSRDHRFLIPFKRTDFSLVKGTPDAVDVAAVRSSSERPVKVHADRGFQEKWADMHVPTADETEAAEALWGPTKHPWQYGCVIEQNMFHTLPESGMDRRRRPDASPTTGHP